MTFPGLRQPSGNRVSSACLPPDKFEIACLSSRIRARIGRRAKSFDICTHVARPLPLPHQDSHTIHSIRPCQRSHSLALAAPPLSLRRDPASASSRTRHLTTRIKDKTSTQRSCDTIEYKQHAAQRPRGLDFRRANKGEPDTQGDTARSHQE